MLLWASSDPASVVPVSSVDWGAGHAGDELFESRVFWPSESDQIDVAVSAVAVGPDGSIYILHRAGRAFGSDTSLIEDPVIIRLDAETGEVMDRFGAHLFASPHGMSVSREGTIWVADTALNTITHLDQSGQPIRRYGDPYPFYLEPLLRLRNILPQLPVPMSDGTFARPTDVVPLPGGSFAVTDGYRNSRLAVFDRDGDLVWQINRRGSDRGEFHLPHGIGSDHHGNLYIADRRNARIQVFSSHGILMNVIEADVSGRPFGIEIGPRGCIYVADGGDGLDTEGPQEHNDMRRGFAVLDQDGGTLYRTSGTGVEVGQYLLPHDVAVGMDGSVYVADLHAHRVLVADLPHFCED